MTRQLHLGAFMRPVGIHTAWWRYPGAYPDANFNLKHLVDFIRTLERGRFDAPTTSPAASPPWTTSATAERGGIL
jgi:hypothetical protein